MIKKVGITGAAGHIGLDLAAGLADKYQLTLFYRYTKPDIALDLKMVQADLSDEKQVKGIFEGLNAVIHLAAASTPYLHGTMFSSKISLPLTMYLKKPAAPVFPK